jgi:hypothetical protein
MRDTWLWLVRSAALGALVTVGLMRAFESPDTEGSGRMGRLFSFIIKIGVLVAIVFILAKACEQSFWKYHRSAAVENGVSEKARPIPRDSRSRIALLRGSDLSENDLMANYSVGKVKLPNLGSILNGPAMRPRFLSGILPGFNFGEDDMGYLNLGDSTIYVIGQSSVTAYSKGQSQQVSGRFDLGSYLIGLSPNPAARASFVDAYKAYSTYSDSGLLVAAAKFSAAVSLDPKFQLAYSGLSDALCQRVHRGWILDTALQVQFIDSAKHVLQAAEAVDTAKGEELYRSLALLKVIQAGTQMQKWPSHPAPQPGMVISATTDSIESHIGGTEDLFKESFELFDKALQVTPKCPLTFHNAAAARLRMAQFLSESSDSLSVVIAGAEDLGVKEKIEKLRMRAVGYFDDADRIIDSGLSRGYVPSYAQFGASLLGRFKLYQKMKLPPDSVRPLLFKADTMLSTAIWAVQNRHAGSLSFVGSALYNLACVKAYFDDDRNQRIGVFSLWKSIDANEFNVRHRADEDQDIKKLKELQPDLFVLMEKQAGWLSQGGVSGKTVAVTISGL